MIVVVYAGPNGSGKSTIVNSVSKILNLLYINPDYIAEEYFSEIEDVEVRYKEFAMPFAEELRKNAILNRMDFSFETVLSAPDKIDFLKETIKEGYEVHAFCVGTNSPDINITRVQKRVEEGGHTVPTDKIISRYYKSMKLIPELIKISKEAVIIDNSKDAPENVLFFSEGRCIALSNDIPDWVSTHIINPLKNDCFISEVDEFKEETARELMPLNYLIDIE